jgi:hypothetical protein
MRSTRKLGLAALIVGAAAALSAGTAFGHKTIVDCAGAQLAGQFRVVPGSGAAGSISYQLTLRNTSTTPCTVTGLPLGQLLGKRKTKLPTHVRAAHPGALTAVLVTLVPGDSTFATARFSPDVPGQGEGVNGPCEPKAYWFRVTAPGGGTTTVKLTPPTPVCEHGRLFFSAYGHKG